jgi:hypothetical protein
VCCRKFKPCKSDYKRNIYGKCVPALNWKKLTDAEKENHLKKYHDTIEEVVKASN